MSLCWLRGQIFSFEIPDMLMSPPPLSISSILTDIVNSGQHCSVWAPTTMYNPLVSHQCAKQIVFEREGPGMQVTSACIIVCIISCWSIYTQNNNTSVVCSVYTVYYTGCLVKEHCVLSTLLHTFACITSYRTLCTKYAPTHICVYYAKFVTCYIYVAWQSTHAVQITAY